MKTVPCRKHGGPPDTVSPEGIIDQNEFCSAACAKYFQEHRGDDMASWLAWESFKGSPDARHWNVVVRDED